MGSQALPPHPEISLLPPEKLSKNFILDEIKENIKDFNQLFPHVDLNILLEQATDVQNKQVDAETQVRQFLKAFRDVDTFHDAFGQLDANTQSMVQKFLDGGSAEDVTRDKGFALPPSPAVKHHFRFLDKLHSFFQGLHHNTANGDDQSTLQDSANEAQVPAIYEDSRNRKIMMAYAGVPFANWGESVKNTPKYTFVPTTVLGLSNLVKYCKINKLRVRCGGYRHSWAPTFSEDGQVLVSLIDLKTVNEIPNPLALGVESGIFDNELASIERLEKPSFSASGKDCVRVGAAVTNEAFRHWSVKNNVYALPMDVILVEVTIGGVNGPICHGAGRRHGTISDQVKAVEYVDANGELQMVTDSKQLKAAAGCFGLLGVVTHITFELEGMIYAVMKPEKIPISLAIPPLQNSDVPRALRRDPLPTEKELQAAKADFENRAANDFYAEWFWYTYQGTAWVNSWNPVHEPEGATEFPSPAGVFLQWLQCWVGGWFSQTFFFQHIPGHWQAQFLAIAGMAVLPPTTFDKPSVEIKTFLPDGLHFFRGIQNTRVRDMEWEIPLPALASDPTKPDLSIVQRAWWDIIKLVYEEAEDGRSPLRLTLELRIMGGSDMLMAAQRGNNFGTASIEVLTVPNAVPEQWETFKQRVADRWMSYEANGVKLNARPHWAKEWAGIQAGGVPIRQYLKQTAYKDAIMEFKAELASIGKGQGWTLDDIQKRFSNELWDEIVYS